MASFALLWLCIERLLRAGVSLIAESNFRPGEGFTAQMRARCEELGTTQVEVYCTAAPDVLWDRFDGRRAAGGRHPGHIGFADRATFLADLQARPHGPLDLGGALITVDTTDTWPDAVAIAARIRASTPR